MDPQNMPPQPSQQYTPPTQQQFQQDQPTGNIPEIPQNNNKTNKGLIIALCVIIPLAIIVIIAVIIVLSLLPTSTTNVPPEVTTTSIIETPSTEDAQRVYGKWLTANGSYFSFQPTEFYWWKTKDDLTDNYYKGDIEILTGEQALTELGATYENVLKLFVYSDGKVQLDDLYALKLYPKYLISGGVDKTENLKQNFPAGKDYMILSFIVINENEAQAYNYNTEDTYYLTRDAEE